MMYDSLLPCRRTFIFMRQKGTETSDSYYPDIYVCILCIHIVELVYGGGNSVLALYRLYMPKF